MKGCDVSTLRSVRVRVDQNRPLAHLLAMRCVAIQLMNVDIIMFYPFHFLPLLLASLLKYGNLNTLPMSRLKLD